MDKNETDFEDLKVKNSKLEICSEDFDSITTVMIGVKEKCLARLSLELTYPDSEVGRYSNYATGIGVSGQKNV